MNDHDTTRERVETVAKGLWDFERDGTDWPAWDETRAEHYGNGMGWKGQCYYRRMARAALAAGAAPGLDELLDSVDCDDLVVSRSYQPKHDIDWAHPGYEFSCDLWSHKDYDNPWPDPISSGTGPTRMAAIADAVAAAQQKEANQ